MAFSFFRVPDVSGNAIAYDANGNMKDQKDKGILDIQYNFLNLPSYMMFDRLYFTRGTWQNENVLNYYRADGTKLKKAHRYSENSSYKLKTTDYLDGFQYETFQNPGLTVLKFVPTSEGYFNFENNKYIYNYADHLGNVRLSYFHNGSSIELLEENNYYPFGLKHDGYNPLAGNTSYQYKYNGKELQETGMYDYGARFYMPDIGRWGVIDEKTEKYRSWNPYNYAINNPIKYVDPDGKDIINITGGVQFTGQDAQIAFRAFQQQAKSSEGINLNKMHFVYEGVTPSIYKHTLNSFRMGKPNVLHYDSDKSRQAQRRKESTGTIPTKPGVQRDEYPYASTFEGGKGANVAYVPSRENSSQGGSLGALYRTMQQGEAFMVIPVPKNREPEDVKDAVPQKVPTAVKVGTGVAAGVIVWEVVKWGAAILLAPETAGASIPAAAALP